MNDASVGDDLLHDGHFCKHKLPGVRTRAAAQVISESHRSIHSGYFAVSNITKLLFAKVHSPSQIQQF